MTTSIRLAEDGYRSYPKQVFADRFEPYRFTVRAAKPIPFTDNYEIEDMFTIRTAQELASAFQVCIDGHLLDGSLPARYLIQGSFWDAEAQVRYNMIYDPRKVIPNIPVCG